MIQAVKPRKADPSFIGMTTRDAILDATERLLGRFGYSKMSMEDIAREAGLSRRTLYLHFSGKEEVVLASIDRIVERLLDRLSQIADSAGSATERIRQILLTRILFRIDSVREYYQGLDDLLSAIRSAYLARRERYTVAESRVLAEVISQGIEAGEIRNVAPLDAANAMIRATASLMPYGLSVRELGAREAVEKQAGAIIDLLLNGIANQPTGDPT